jgi:hypothetical protein
MRVGPTCTGSDLVRSPRTTSCVRAPGIRSEVEAQVVYAIVRAGGRQEKVEVGTVLTVDRQKAAEDGTVSFAPVLLVDGETGYKKRQGHRQELSRVRITAIG